MQYGTIEQPAPTTSDSPTCGITLSEGAEWYFTGLVKALGDDAYVAVTTASGELIEAQVLGSAEDELGNARAIYIRRRDALRGSEPYGEKFAVVVSGIHVH
jgi:hypothetical protein